ncbi:leucine-rich repeat-containing protein 25 [Choloepus didactylus]|uniref:leucine-rich repeat-containing protein 25 n=1 Tax=Choloepus didactylus TaxID=27675 RepID=UPI00189E6722|nr:leucine-rich repeat-containing protein 25 [Choloepus didactylus]XP_037673962.1 leucine-rich repeat-containing protein 25 [Choloepus didactylus]
MEGALAWVLPLLPLLLQDPGSWGLSCSVSSEPVNWNVASNAQCLNFSGLGLSLPQNQSLQVGGLELLDLSRNGLPALPPAFFADLEKLRILNVTGSRLGRVDRALALRCELDLRADCGCGLAAWHEARRDNCSGQLPLQCLDAASGAWHNLSAFLEAGCPPGLGPAAIGGLVAGGSLLAGVAVAGLVLAWRLWGRWTASTWDTGKTRAAQEGPRPGSGRQPRYGSRGLGSRPPAGALASPCTSDYENVFVGPPDAGPSLQGDPWAEHRASEQDFYMNYESEGQDNQPIYCNLQSLTRVPPDEEEYVIPGH